MSERDKPVLIYSTFPSAESAEKAGRGLIEDRLAACVNILPSMKSIYRWDDDIETADEVVMLIKTRGQLVEQVIEATKSAHPYDVPAVVVLKIEAGFQPYLDWVMSETRRD